MFKLEIAFDPQNGKPFLVEEPGASWLKFYPNPKAMKLAYRLMSIGSGGETRRLEQFERIF